MILDEPVNGLDPEGIRWIRGLLKALAAEGWVVLVSSHLISKMALTADRLVVIGRGGLIAQTMVGELSARYASLEDAFFDLTEGAADYVTGDLPAGPEGTMTGLAAVGQMEWIKLRSLRSTAWIFVIFAVSRSAWQSWTWAYSPPRT